jgi:hypothetical protein
VPSRRRRPLVDVEAHERRGVLGEVRVQPRARRVLHGLEAGVDEADVHHALPLGHPREVVDPVDDSLAFGRRCTIPSWLVASELTTTPP